MCSIILAGVDFEHIASCIRKSTQKKHGLDVTMVTQCFFGKLTLSTVGEALRGFNFSIFPKFNELVHLCHSKPHTRGRAYLRTRFDRITSLGCLFTTRKRIFAISHWLHVTGHKLPIKLFKLKLRSKFHCYIWI